MKLIDKLTARFRKPTIADIMDKDYAEFLEAMRKDYEDEHVEHVAGRTFIVIWFIADADEGFKRIADGFHTKQAARDFAEACEHRTYLGSYYAELH